MQDSTRGDLEAAYRAHRDALLRLARLLTDRNAEAEDLVQKAFSRFAVHVGHVDQAAQRAYLRQIVINEWRRESKAARKERELAEQGLASDGFEDPWEARTTLLSAWGIIQALPPRQKAVLILRLYEDLPLQEIAHLLECRVGTVKSQLHKGLRKVREELKVSDGQL